MDVRIKATNYEITPTVTEYVEERLMAVRHLLGSSGSPARCEVEVGRIAGHPRHGEVWFAEINLQDASDGQFFARATGETVNAAVDVVKDEILAQMRKHKQMDRGALKKSGAFLKRLLRRDR